MDTANIVIVNQAAQVLLQSIRELSHLVVVSPSSLSLSSSSSSSSLSSYHHHDNTYQCNENGTFIDIVLSNSSAPVEKALLKVQALAIPDVHIMIYAKVRIH